MPAIDKITYYRDDVVTIAKGMARDPSVVDATSRFPVAWYRNVLKEAYLYHLSILPLPLMRMIRQKAAYSIPVGFSGLSSFFCTGQPPSYPSFSECGTTPEYAGTGYDSGPYPLTSLIAGKPQFCLRVITISVGPVICEFVNTEEELLLGEQTAYFKGTAGKPRVNITGPYFKIAPWGSTISGSIIYIPRPYFYKDYSATPTDENYLIRLEAEAIQLLAKYVACRKFEIDGEGQAYQMLHGEYLDELKNLMSVYGSQREDK